MNAGDIKLNDWMRILIGEVPPGYLLELMVRAAAIYLILLFSIRLMGKRMSSQLSRNELAALVSLAAAIGVPMMAPDRGILPGVVVAFVIVTIERLIAKKAFHSQRFEKTATGNISMLIADGVIDIHELGKVRIARERLCAQLRSMGVKQLGNVERFYMEASGGFTLIEKDDPVAGLSLLPSWDIDFINKFEFDAEMQVCDLCGFKKVKPAGETEVCENCGTKEWRAAVSDEPNK